jgi:hypothetical protein
MAEESLTLRMRAVGARGTARDVRRVAKEVDDLDGHVGGATKNTNTFSKALSVFTGAAASASGAVGSGSSGGGGLRGSIGGLTGVSGGATVAVYGVAAVIVGSLIPAAVALGSSLLVAVGALTALAVAAAAMFGGALLVGVGGLTLAVFRFQQQMEMSGTAAYELNRAAGRTFDMMNQAFGGGIDTVFRALTVVLRQLRPLFAQLEGPVNMLSGAFASFILAMGDVFQDPAFIAGVQQFVLGLAQLAGPAAQLAAVLMPFFLQLANAALPVVVDLIGDAAVWMAQLLGNGKGMALFSSFLAFAMPHLQQWWELTKALAPVFLGLLLAAAPFGLELAKWLTVILQKMGAWLNSAGGQERMRQFFAQVIPLAKQVLIAFGRLVLIFFQLVEAAAPSLTAIFWGLNKVTGGVIWLLDKLAQFVNWATGGLPAVEFAIEGIGTAWNGVKDAFKAAYDFIAPKIQWLLDKINAVVGGIGSLPGAGRLGLQATGKAGAALAGTRALGGPVTAGADYLVGERGPEIFRPSGSGRIASNDEAFGNGPSDIWIAATFVTPSDEVTARQTVRAARRRKAVR